jgi:hypothetical protein
MKLTPLAMFFSSSGRQASMSFCSASVTLPTGWILATPSGCKQARGWGHVSRWSSRGDSATKPDGGDGGEETTKETTEGRTHAKLDVGREELEVLLAELLAEGRARSLVGLERDERGRDEALLALVDGPEDERGELGTGCVAAEAEEKGAGGASVPGRRGGKGYRTRRGEKAAKTVRGKRKVG